MSKNTDKKQTPKDPLGIYRQALHISDADSLHDVIIREGATILEKGLPYVVLAARWRQLSEYRTRLRQKDLLVRGSESRDKYQSQWDPFERIAANEVYRIIIESLAKFADEDVIIIYDHFRGLSDTQIQEKLLSLGLKVEGINPVLIRKRRQRLLKQLRFLVQKKIHSGK
jgi:hypothetical protein